MLTFEATAEAQYYILVGDDGRGPGDIRLNWQMGTPPANDNFSSATVLSGSGGTANGNTMFATAETPEPAIFTGHSVWYTWTAPDNLAVTFDTCGSSTHYASLGVYTGDAPNALTTVADGYAGYNGGWVNNYCDDQVSLGFTPVQGITYHIGVGFDGQTMGPFVLHWPSSISTLTAPAVTTQPTSQTVSAGDGVQFDAAATGIPAPTVQWQVSTDNGSSWSDVATAIDTSLSFTAAYSENGNQYRAVFTNDAGSTPSDAATLTVTAIAPAVTTQPDSLTVVAGNTAEFHAAASGNPPPTMQWQSLPPGGGSWADIDGAVNPYYDVYGTTVAISGTQYRAVFTNPGGSVTTDAATLTVFNLPAAPTTPSAASTTAKGKLTVTLTWSDNGDGGSAITDHNILVYSYRAATKNRAASYSYITALPTRSTSTSATITVKGGSYAFTVEAVNAGGQGAESGYSNVVTR
jgi:hypothetical protein